MRYMLIIQFSPTIDCNFELLVSLEEIFGEKLSGMADVDGHDWGSGEMNIFIITERPEETFGICTGILHSHSLMSGVKVAYRLLDGDEYTCLWPKGMTEFSVT